MLNEHERRTLRDLERRLRAEDPDFPRTFNARARHLGRRMGRPARVLGIVVTAAICVLLLIAGQPGGVLALLAGVGLLHLAWRWRHEGGPAAGPAARDDGD